MCFHSSVYESMQIRGAVAFHRQVCVPCVRAVVHYLTSYMLVFMCQGLEAEGRGQGSFLTRDMLVCHAHVLGEMQWGTLMGPT